MASGLLMLLDDISTLLDDVAILTKVAGKKTAGILGDDLALNAQQVVGVQANRELPIVWAVAKGSFVNKVMLVPSALLLSAVAAWAIKPLLIAGGAYLCFEGCEKLAHKFFHSAEDSKHRQENASKVADPQVDIVAEEKSKISGAVRTDFILSAEIIVITLGTVVEAGAGFMTQLAVLASIGMLMTVGVYGLVAGIVKIDDWGLRLISTPRERFLAGLRIRAGHGIVTAAPYLMKFLSVAGTAAMFLVGGGILAHGIPWLHNWIEVLTHRLAEVAGIGGAVAWLAEMALHGLLGVLIGAAVLLVVSLSKTIYRKYTRV